MASSQQKFNAGQTQGHTQAKAEDWIQSTKETADSAADKCASATNTNQQHAQQKKEEAAGIIQQTGEKVASAAQGAVDAVKNTLGVNDQKKN